MSLFMELKRRNVFRVGIAYAVFAWLSMQVGNVLFDAFNAPDWALRGLIIALAIGFPLFLLGSWALEWTPEGLKWDSEVSDGAPTRLGTRKKLNNLILVLALLAVAYLLFDKLYLRDAMGTSAPTTAPGAEISADRRSIAVLPFENRSRLEEDVYFVDGIHDDLLTNLARISELKVISRTTVSLFRGSEKTLPEIAAELGVAHIMEGAVQRSGDTVRINVQLIDAATDEHVWAEIYDRQLTADTLFGIQSEISSQIAEALRATLSPEEEQRISGRATNDLVAYNAYLRGRQALTLNNSIGAKQALAEFRNAVEADPSFALAWAALANAVNQNFRYSDTDLDTARSLLEEAAGQALALDDQLGESHLAQDLLIAYRDGHWNQTREQSLSRALELSPGLAEAWLRYSEYLGQFDGRRVEALAAVERAAELDPLSKRIRNQQVQILSSLGRFDEAETRLAELIALDPDFAINYVTMSNLLADRGRFAESLAWRRKAQQKDPGNILYQLHEVWLLTSMNMADEYAGLVERVSRLDPNSSTEAFAETIINLRQNRLDAALETASAYADELTPASFEGFGFRGVVHSFRNEPEPALADIRLSFSANNKGRQMDANGWMYMARVAPERACTLAWIIGRAEDAELGQNMAAATLERIYNELPAHRQAALAMDRAQCHVLVEDSASAIAAIQEAIANRQLMGWWFQLQHPTFNDLRPEPEFQQALADIERIMAEERARFHALTEEAGP